jgi:hypothetical protein
VDPASPADRRFDLLERWERMPLAAQRRLLRELAGVSLAPAGGRDTDDPGRVRILFR